MKIHWSDSIPGQTVVHAVAERYRDRQGKKYVPMGELWCGRRMKVGAKKVKGYPSCRTCVKAILAQHS